MHTISGFVIQWELLLIIGGISESVRGGTEYSLARFVIMFLFLDCVCVAMNMITTVRWIFIFISDYRIPTSDKVSSG